MSSRFASLALILSLLTLGACTAAGPNALTIGTIDRGPNPYPRGTDAFCKRYAEQTFASTFEIHSGASSDAWAEQQARVSGQAAYERCKQGKTN